MEEEDLETAAISLFIENVVIEVQQMFIIIIISKEREYKNKNHSQTKNNWPENLW